MTSWHGLDSKISRAAFKIIPGYLCSVDARGCSITGVTEAYDADLGERDESTSDEFPPSDRQIHTQAYDLSINTLKEQWDDELLIIPDFQRDYVWDNAKASRLIESLLLNIPVPVLFFAETDDARYQIVDGHQRVRSIVRFLENEFALSGLRMQGEFKGKRFFQLPVREQRFLRTRVIRAIIIGVDSSDSMKFEVFERLNTGGLALNAQEIRHGINSGPLMVLLGSLARYPAFRWCVGTSKPRKRMVDEELILRFFALRDGLARYRAPLLRLLNEYAKTHANASERWQHGKTELFERTMSITHEVMGDTAFRVVDTTGRPTERVLNRALFEAQALAFSICDEEEARDNAEDLVQELAMLFTDEAFVDSIRRATGDTTRTLRRIGKTLDAFESAGVSVDRSALGAVKFPKD
jgi:hypothetical protein